MRVAWLIILCAFIAGCGSGSNGTTATEGNVMLPQPAPGAASVQITTQGPTADTVLYAAQFTLRFPPGVSLPATTGGELLPPEVLRPAPSGSFAGASYIPPAAGLGPAIQVNVSHPGGFTVGPLATVNCTVTPGVELSAGDITIQGFSARDSNGAPIPGIATRLTLQTQ